MRRPVPPLLFLTVLLSSAPAPAVPVDALEPGRVWRVGKIEFRGSESLPESKLRDAMTTKERPWYRFWQFWRPRPEVDPVTLRDDVDRLGQLYRNEGFYHVRVDHDVEVPDEGDRVRILIVIHEGSPVYVESVTIDLEGEPLAPKERDVLLKSIPLERGERFRQEEYARVVTVLRTYYREHGFARVEVTRRTEVDVRRDAADVRYRVESGPPSVFGEVTVSGTRAVSPDVIRREVAFEPGEPFKQSLLERTRRNLVALKLFRSIRLQEKKGTDPRVDIRIRVAEGPSHEVRLGAGYETEEQIRGVASWRAYNFFGGARQLGFTARASFLRRSVAADFLQPHFPRQGDRIRLILSETQEEEDLFDNDRARFTPRIEFRANPDVTPYAFYRIEYDSLSNVHKGVRPRFPDIAPDNALVSGLGVGVDWNSTDDLLDPTRGWVVSGSVEPVGEFLGGDVSFLRFLAEARRYQRLPEGLFAAFRLRLGAADPIGDGREIPLFERFYAGGTNSVRGYERRHVAEDEAFELRVPRKNRPGTKIVIGDDPVGGRTLVESSVELGHPITEKIGAVVFLDAGQVALDSYDFRFDDLRFGTGFGLRYKSPVGPLRVDLGFPLEPPAGDAHWQIHLSIGQAF